MIYSEKYSSLKNGDKIQFGVNVQAYKKKTFQKAQGKDPKMLDLPESLIRRSRGWIYKMRKEMKYAKYGEYKERRKKKK